MRKLPFLFFCLLLIVSCSDKKKVPKDILPVYKMEAVLWDMISAGEYLNGFVLNKDSIDKFAESSAIYGRVLQLHHISREQFDKSYLYYRGRMDLMKIVLDSLSKKQVIPEEVISPQKDTVQQKDTLKLSDTLKQSAALKYTDNTLKRPDSLKKRRPKLSKRIRKKTAGQ
jgi:hypothetical protein